MYAIRSFRISFFHAIVSESTVGLGCVTPIPSKTANFFYSTRSEWVEYLIWCPQICSISYYGAHQVPRCWETGKKCVRFAVFEKKLKTILKNGPFSPVFCEFTWLWHISGFTTLSKDETQLPVLLTLIPQLLWISESPVAPKTTINLKCYRL